MDFVAHRVPLTAMADSDNRSLGAAPTDPDPRDADGDLAAGSVLGKYRIVRKLGAGGMGAVYEAVHTGLGRPVALKTLASRLAAEATARERFLREAEASSRLEHPNVVAVTDFGAEQGTSYLVMELLRGEDLAGLLRRHPAGLPVTDVADTMLAVCAGVFAAHGKGIVHRDLKPSNIFLARTSLGDVVPKVLDFGIAKQVEVETGHSLTSTGNMLGTGPYLSPEQITAGAVDVRSDQYTMGVILYECATGERPHEGNGLFALTRNIVEGKFVPPCARRPDLPPALEAVILRAMSLAPKSRYESMHALGRALLPFASAKRRVLWSDYFESDRPGAGVLATKDTHPVTPEKDLPPTSTRTFPGPDPGLRRRTFMLPLLAAIALAVAAAAWLLLRAPSPAPPAAPAAATKPAPPPRPMPSPPPSPSPPALSPSVRPPPTDTEERATPHRRKRPKPSTAQPRGRDDPGPAKAPIVQ